LALNPTFDVPKKKCCKPCCCAAPSQWGLTQKVQDIYAGEAPWVHALRVGEAWVLHSCQSNCDIFAQNIPQLFETSI